MKLSASSLIEKRWYLLLGLDAELLGNVFGDS